MRLTKHHALGNDFLVHLAAAPVAPADVATWSRRAVALCHRRRGIGADGLIVSGPVEPGADASTDGPMRVGPAGAGMVTRDGPMRVGPAGGRIDATMLLLNADGSRAEMSGNGIRCLAHALAVAHGRPTGGTYRIATDAGVRTVIVDAPAVSAADSIGPGTVVARVDMGAVTDLDPPVGWAAVGCDPMRPVAHLSLGNPHTVVGVDDLDAVDLAAIGAQLSAVNIEIVTAGPAHHEVVMRVHERGVGITESCGTGACAAAVAATRWGLAAPKDGEILVTMDGGVARVQFGPAAAAGAGTAVTLVGPATLVATVEVDP